MIGLYRSLHLDRRPPRRDLRHLIDNLRVEPVRTVVVDTVPTTPAPPPTARPALFGGPGQPPGERPHLSSTFPGDGPHVIATPHRRLPPHHQGRRSLSTVTPSPGPAPTPRASWSRQRCRAASIVLDSSSDAHVRRSRSCPTGPRVHAPALSWLRRLRERHSWVSTGPTTSPSEGWPSRAGTRRVRDADPSHLLAWPWSIEAQNCAGAGQCWFGLAPDGSTAKLEGRRQSPPSGIASRSMVVNVDTFSGGLIAGTDSAMASNDMAARAMSSTGLRIALASRAAPTRATAGNYINVCFPTAEEFHRCRRPSHQAQIDAGREDADTTRRELRERPR
jgi:hypothetical protein